MTVIFNPTSPEYLRILKNLLIFQPKEQIHISSEVFILFSYYRKRSYFLFLRKNLTTARPSTDFEDLTLVLDKAIYSDLQYL
jgi:hypothetical protein